MSLNDWVSESVTEVRKHGFAGVKWSWRKLLAGGLRRVGRTVNYGIDHLDEDWEVLVLLDACRPDVLAEVAAEDGYDWIPEVETRYSCASQSKEWIDKTLNRLPDEEAAELGIISGNGFTADRVDADRFHTLTTLGGRDEYWDADRELLARVTTDHAIDLWRGPDRPRRMIVWYMQPHTPLPNVDIANRFSAGVNECDLARRGELSPARFVEGHRQNVRSVLASVEVLLNNVDADPVVISADHAELFGEYGLFCHPAYVPLPRLKRVPWIRTTATDTGSREPDVEIPSSPPEDLDEHLSALGYRNE